MISVDVTELFNPRYAQLSINSGKRFINAIDFVVEHYIPDRFERGPYTMSS